MKEPLATDMLSMDEVERCSHSLTPEAGERLVATFEMLKRSAEWEAKQRELTAQRLLEVEQQYADLAIHLIPEGVDLADGNPEPADVTLRRIIAESERAREVRAERDDAYRLLNESHIEIDRLRALVERMRDKVSIALHHFANKPEDQYYSTREEAGAALESLLADPEGQAAAEEMERLRWAERRLTNITQTCRAEFGQVRMGEPAESILDRVAEEMRLLREYESARAAYLYGDAYDADAERHENSWAALRAFREGQK